jgi:predicted phage terminase large subunit-like protein
VTEKEQLIQLLQETDAAAKLALAQAARNDLYFMAKHIMGYDLMTPHTHGNLCAIIESTFLNPSDCMSRITPRPKVTFEGGRDIDVFNRELDINQLQKKFRLILMPRGSFKSTIATITYPLMLLLHNPNLRILIDSETFEKSRAFLSEMRGHMMDNEKYRDLYHTLHGVYPDDNRRDDKWSDTEFNIAGKHKKTKEPTVSCAGVGVTKVGMHYDVIISDDLQSEKNVTTKDAIRGVVDHYKLNLSLLEPDGFMIMIGTRWDYNDVYQYIIDNEADRFCIFAEQAERPDGSLLFPERLTREFLDSQKRSQGSNIYSMQYQNLPIDDETATFKFSQMRRVSWNDVKDRPINWFLSVDPAISQTNDADFTAMVVAGFDYQKNIYVRHIDVGKYLPSEIVDHVFYLYERFKPSAIGLETVAFQKSLQYAINDRMRERGWWLPLKEIKRKNQQSKEDRIRGLQPYYEYGRVFHINDSPAIDDLEYQLIHFPKAKNDDIIDALADILEIGFPPMKKQREGVHDESDSAKRRRLDKLTKPRSWVTRY